MLVLTKSIVDRPILSLRTGGVVARAISPIINPNNLKIEGFYCLDSVDKKKQLILVTQDIREILNVGIVIDDHSVLAEAEDLVRLHKIMRLDFDLIGKSVITKSGKRMGKVNDYATEPESMIIKKIYVTQTLLKNLTGGSLSVDRTQIIEINNKKIIIKDPLQGVRTGAAAINPLPAS